MKISEVTVQTIKDYTKIEYIEEDLLIQNILQSVKAYIKSFTGLTYEAMDSKEDLTIVLMILVAEMIENRQYSVQNDKVNQIVKSILNMHCTNLL